MGFERRVLEVGRDQGEDWVANVGRPHGDGGSLPQINRRVLVLDDVSDRRAATCAQLEREGYVTFGAGDVRSLMHALDDELPTVLLYDVSAPRSWREVTSENALIRTLIAGRCPVVLYGDRPPMEFSELEWACQSAAHIPTGDGGRALLALLRRLLPVDETRPTTPAPSRPDFENELAHVRLLLIDDSELTLEVMQSRLSSVGFDVRIAIALGEVRSIVTHWAPNMIVADVKRPDIPGDELCARLKATVHRKDVLIVLCSSLPEPELRDLATAARADGYVSKANGLDGFVTGLRALSKKLLAPTFVDRNSARGA